MQIFKKYRQSIIVCCVFFHILIKFKPIITNFKTDCSKKNTVEPAMSIYTWATEKVTIQDSLSVNTPLVHSHSDNFVCLYTIGHMNKPLGSMHECKRGTSP